MGVMTSMLVMAGVSTAISAYSQWKAGKSEAAVGQAQQRSAEKQAQLADYNAAVAELQSLDAYQRGELEANRFRARTRGVVGEQRTQFAAGNIDVGYGSTVDVQADAAFLGELDALTISNNAAREAWGYRVEKKDLEMQADILRTEGANALTAGIQRRNAQRLGAVSNVFGGAGSMLSTYYGFRSTPTGGGARAGRGRGRDTDYRGDAVRSEYPHT